MSVGGDGESDADGVECQNRVAETGFYEVVGMGKAEEEDCENSLEIDGDTDLRLARRGKAESALRRFQRRRSLESGMLHSSKSPPQRHPVESTNRTNRTNLSSFQCANTPRCALVNTNIMSEILLPVHECC